MPHSAPRRILAIDDNRAIHEDYCKVLLNQNDSRNSQLDAAESLIFGEPSGSENNSCVDSLCFEIDSAHQGQEGLQFVKKSLTLGRPYSVAFIDIRMPPGWDGIETTRKIWEVDPDLPVVLCTAYTDYSWDEIVRKLDQSDQLLILKKPFDNIELRQLAHCQAERRRLKELAVFNHQELERRVRERTLEMQTTRDLVFFSLARLAESRDKSTGEHLERIQTYTALLAQWLSENGPYQNQIDQEYVHRLSVSSVLHDIGKVGIPDSILLKPGPLTPDEFEIMKRHVSIGAEALDEAIRYSECCDFLTLAAEIAKYHHERFDGTGYLCGLKGDEIPLSARIVAVADVFDALTSDRVYKAKMSVQDAREMILAETGRHFDPEIIKAFEACQDEFENLADAMDASPTDKKKRLGTPILS